VQARRSSPRDLGRAGDADTIVSPSFVLMAEYQGRLPLFHADLYRLADAADALAGGLVDDRQVEGVTLWNGRNGWRMRCRTSGWMY